MKRTLFSIILIISCYSYSLAHISLVKGNHNEQQVAFRTEKVSGTVYVLFGQGGNIGVSVGADGILMIDDQFANIADKI